MKRRIAIFACGLLTAPISLAVAQPQMDPPANAPGYTTPGYRGPAHAMPRPQRVNPSRSMRRWADSEGYHLQVYTGSDNPEALDIRVRGRSLLLRSNRSLQSDRTDSQGVRSFQHSFSRFSRQITIPRDADPANMKTHVQDGFMTITLPRLGDYQDGFRGRSPGPFSPPAGYR